MAAAGGAAGGNVAVDRGDAQMGADVGAGDLDLWRAEVADFGRFTCCKPGDGGAASGVLVVVDGNGCGGVLSASSGRGAKQVDGMGVGYRSDGGRGVAFDGRRAAAGGGTSAGGGLVDAVWRRVGAALWRFASVVAGLAGGGR